MDNFDLKKYLAEGRLHEEVGSDGRLYGHEGNPKLKHSKTHNSSNVDIEKGDYVKVLWPSGGYSAGVVLEVSRNELVYYEEENTRVSSGRGLEEVVVINFDEIGDIKKTGEKKQTSIPYPFSDDDNDTEGNVYIVTTIEKLRK